MYKDKKVVRELWVRHSTHTGWKGTAVVLLDNRDDYGQPMTVSSCSQLCLVLLCGCPGDLRESSAFESLTVFSTLYLCGLEFNFIPAFLFVLLLISLI